MRATTLKELQKAAVASIVVIFFLVSVTISAAPSNDSTSVAATSSVQEPLLVAPEPSSKWATEDPAYFCIRDSGPTSCVVTTLGDSLRGKNVSLVPFWVFYGVFRGHETGIDYDDHPIIDHQIVREGKDVVYSVNISLPTSYAFYLAVYDAAGNPRTYHYSDTFLNPKTSTRDFTAVFSPNTSTSTLTFSENSKVLIELDCQGLYPLFLVNRTWEDDFDFDKFGFDGFKDLQPWQSNSCEEDRYLLENYFKVFRDIPAPLTDTTEQQKLKASFLLVSGFLSILGSGYLVFAILIRYRKTRYTTVRDRILFMMSCCDLINSTCLALGPIPSPQGKIDMIWASGNQGTCRAQGFGIQLGFGTPAYTVMLGIYYLSIVSWGKSEEQIQRQEWWMQAIPCCYAVATSFAGLFLDLYNSNGTFCWIEAYPKDCTWNGWHGCTRGGNASTFVWAFAGGPLIGCSVFILGTMGWLIATLSKRHIEARQRRQSSNALLTRSAATQALLYILAFFMTYTWGFIISSCIMFGVPLRFPIHVLNSIFLPLQGFLNCFIFLRPTYQRIRNRQRSRRTSNKQSIFASMWEAMKSESVSFNPPLRPRRRSVHLTTQRRRPFALTSRSGFSFDSFDTREITAAPDPPSTSDADKTSSMAGNSSHQGTAIVPRQQQPQEETTIMFLEDSRPHEDQCGARDFGALGSASMTTEEKTSDNSMRNEEIVDANFGDDVKSDSDVEQEDNDKKNSDDESWGKE